MIKEFEEYVEQGMITKRYPDLLRAKSLVHDAEKRKGFLSELTSKIGLNDDNANNFLETAYDIIMSLLRAKLLSVGYNTTNSHEAEIAFMNKLGFTEAEVRFMDELRYIRNGILYYGKEYDKEYATKVLSFLDKNYSKLKNF